MAMSDLPAAQRQALEAWAEQAIEAGWLSSNARQSLSGMTTNAPGDLFEQNNRPLVAGLFGGTGVGKSTLLNRLAAEPIARASAERPTSRDITLYVHRSISVDKLPDTFPMERMRTSIHSNEQYRHVLFIDMPDFDSVESSNRDLVDLWLPHLDVVLYVVSPERYRDDQGWRLLLKHGREHAWLFVMNHWDRADPAQLEDFRAQLAGAGLNNPMIFRTDSSTLHGAQAADGESSTSPATSQSATVDDFDDLQVTLKELSDQSIIENLQEHGILARLKALQEVSDTWLDSLGSESVLQNMAARWQAHWQSGTADIEQSMQWKIQAHAERYAQSEGFWLSLFKRKSNTVRPPESNTPLIDEAFLDRLDNTLEDFLNQQAQQEGLSLRALKQAVAQPYALSRRDVTDRVDDSLAHSLALPGTKWHRGLFKAAGLLCVLLPLASMAWISWRVVGGFVDGGSDPSAYLSSNFAINGSLLLGLSWLLPAFAHKKLKPSRQQAAAKGLKQGVSVALSRIDAQVFQALNELSASAATARSAYQQLWQTLPTDQSDGLPEPFKRLLASGDWQSVHRSLDVRANTHSSTDAAPVS